MPVLIVAAIVIFALVRHRRRKTIDRRTTSALTNVLGVRPADAPRFVAYPRGRRVSLRRGGR